MRLVLRKFIVKVFKTCSATSTFRNGWFYLYWDRTVRAFKFIL